MLFFLFQVKFRTKRAEDQQHQKVRVLVGYAETQSEESDWNADYDVVDRETDFVGDLNFTSSSSLGFEEDSAAHHQDDQGGGLEDEQELKTFLSSLLRNDSDFVAMNENIYVIYTRLLELEAKLNNTVSALMDSAKTQLVVTTTDPTPRFTTTTQVYVASNAADNAEINSLLNRLAELRHQNGLEIIASLKSNLPLNQVKFSDNVVVDEEVHNVLYRLKDFSQMYGLTFKTYLEKMEASTRPDVTTLCNNPQSSQDPFLTMHCMTKLLKGKK